MDIAICRLFQGCSRALAAALALSLWACAASAPPPARAPASPRSAVSVRGDWGASLYVDLRSGARVIADLPELLAAMASGPRAEPIAAALRGAVTEAVFVAPDPLSPRWALVVDARGLEVEGFDAVAVPSGTRVQAADAPDDGLVASGGAEAPGSRRGGEFALLELRGTAARRASADPPAQAARVGLRAASDGRLWVLGEIALADAVSAATARDTLARRFSSFADTAAASLAGLAEPARDATFERDGSLVRVRTRIGPAQLRLMLGMVASLRHLADGQPAPL